MVKKIILGVVTLLVALVGLTFSLKNNSPVIIKYYFNVEWQTTLALVILASFVIGLFVGYLLNFSASIVMRRNLVRARRDVQQAEQEVANLRSLPIKDAL